MAEPFYAPYEDEPIKPLIPRKVKWLTLYLFSFTIGATMYPFVFMATPILGAFPKSPKNIHYVAWKHATQGYGAWSAKG